MSAFLLSSPPPLPLACVLTSPKFTSLEVSLWCTFYRYGCEYAISNYSQAVVRVYSDGTVEVAVGGCEIGQGLQVRSIVMM